MSRIHPRRRKSSRVFEDDAHDSYFVAMAAIRLRAILRGDRWAEEGETFDLVLATVLMRRVA